MTQDLSGRKSRALTKQLPERYLDSRDVHVSKQRVVDEFVRRAEISRAECEDEDLDLNGLGAPLETRDGWLHLGSSRRTYRNCSVHTRATEEFKKELMWQILRDGLTAVEWFEKAVAAYDAVEADRSGTPAIQAGSDNVARPSSLVPTAPDRYPQSARRTYRVHPVYFRAREDMRDRFKRQCARDKVSAVVWLERAIRAYDRVHGPWSTKRDE